MRPDDERRTMKELGFKTWLSDVLWYHYKGAILLGLAAVAVFLFIVLNQMLKPKNDVVIVLAVERGTGIERLNEIRLAAGKYFEEDGKKANVSVVELVVGSESSDFLPGDPMKMAASFMQPEMVLYLMDEANTKRYGDEPGRFSPSIAAEYGATGETAIYLGDAALFVRLGYTGENRLYAFFKERHYNATDEERWYDAARLALNGLLEAE